MRVEGIRALTGPNIYHHEPVMLMRLHLEGLSEVESRDVRGFNERLIELLPGILEHHCSRNKSGGFVERLYEGTYFSHIVEHVTLELSEGAGIPVNFGKARYADAPGLYNIIVSYRAEQGMRYLLKMAVELVEALVKGETFTLDERLQEARRIVAHTELGPSTRAIVDAAERRGIPYFRLNSDSLVQLGYGKNRRLVQAAMCDRTSGIAIEIAGDKELTKSILEQASIPVPRGRTVETEAEAIRAFDELGAPLVIKPLDGCQGKGVSLNLKTPEQIAEAFRIAQQFSHDVLVEEMVEGRDYRVLVVNGRFTAASERLPCHVTGDGQRTLSELIELTNEDPLRGEGHANSLTKIVVDALVLSCLRKRGCSLDYKPLQGERVFLRETANLSTGGTARDVTDVVHPQIVELCERAARVIGLDICGLDLVVPDITEPFTRGGFVEANAAPGLRMHCSPSEGAARDVGGAIVEMLYPKDAPARIPLISITGTNGKTTVTRMIAHILGESGKMVGMTTTDGIYIGGKCVAEGDTTGPQSARVVLSDPAVEVAVLETARGGIARRGLGYDWSDIAVLTNITPDHIGQDGIQTIEDLVHIKSLIAERVREGGTLILNADDEQLSRLTERPGVSRLKKSVIYFSLSENHLLIRRHTSEGGAAYFVRGDRIVEAVGQDEHEIVRVSEVPLTLGGAARFQVSNVLACVAACRAEGMEREDVASAIKSFRNEVHNPGRANIYAVGGGHVLVDYGHNPEAFESVCRMASAWRGRTVTGIIGVPGDRDNSLIEQAGRVAARGFSRIIIKEDKDLRGRAEGEVARLLCNAVKAEAPDRECLMVLDETEALEDELRRIGPGTIVVIFYDKLAPVQKLLEQYGAVSAPTIEETMLQLSAVSV